VRHKTQIYDCHVAIAFNFGCTVRVVCALAQLPFLFELASNICAQNISGWLQHWREVQARDKIVRLVLVLGVIYGQRVESTTDNLINFHHTLHIILLTPISAAYLGQ
jgi:hypothetical protein